MHDDLRPWAEFNVAMAGASAALAGLIIVAMSVNITRIVGSAGLPARAGAAIGTLTLTVASSCLPLIPDQSLRLLGIEILCGAAVVLVFAALAARAIVTGSPMSTPVRLAKAMLGFLSPTLFTVGAIGLVSGGADDL